MLQVCFAIILFALIKLFNLYVRITQAPAMRMARRQSSAGTEGKKRKRNGKLNRIRTFMTWSDSSALSKVSVAAATTLVDYQEAQGWFVFALQIASVLAIVVTSQEGSFWNEIVVNAAVAFHVSQNGILPMFLVQICLHVEGIRSTHTFVGFLVEYVLAVVAASQRIRFNNVFDLFREQSPIAGCGGNPSPRSYCASVRAVDGLRISFFPHPMVYKLVFLVLDSLAVAALVVDHIAWEVRKRTRARSPDSTSSLSFGLGRRLRNSSLRPRWFKFKRVFWHTLEFLYLIVNVLYVCSLTRVMTDESFDPSRWSYGQIIAMTVWGPVIVQMVSMAICRFNA